MKIFVIDDEKNIRNLIDKYLKKENYNTFLFDGTEDIIKEFNNIKPDLIVLDIMMKDIDGLTLCKEIRKISEVPIIFVSAKNEEFDRILALELGGDDYLAKPFSPRELVIRIKKILKRVGHRNEKDNNKIIIKDVILDSRRRNVYLNEKEVEFTKKEFDLLEFLFINKNIAFKREVLIEKIWGYDYIGDTRVVDDLIKRIRKKLKLSKIQIKTVWGFGYKVDEDE